MVDHRSVDWSPPDLPTKAAKLCASQPSEAPSTLPPPTSIPSPSIFSTSDRLLAPGQSGHLAIFTFCTSLSFYPSRQYQNLQFNMYLYITTTLCQFLKIPQDQVVVHLMTSKKCDLPDLHQYFMFGISKSLTLKSYILQAIGWSTKKVVLYPKTLRHLDIPSRPIPSCLLISSLTVRCN